MHLKEYFIIRIIIMMRICFYTFRPLNDDVKIQTRVIKGIQVSGCFVMDFKKYLQKAVSKSSEVGIGQSPSHLSCTEHIFYQNLTTNIARKELALKKKKAEFEDRGFDMRKPVSRGSWRVSAKGDRHVPRKTSQSFNSGARRRHRLQVTSFNS